MLAENNWSEQATTKRTEYDEAAKLEAPFNEISLEEPADVPDNIKPLAVGVTKH